jgi:CubicO group peptidase (beta-lactamase class C family)
LTLPFNHKEYSMTVKPTPTVRAAATLMAALAWGPPALAQSWTAAKTEALDQFVNSALQTAAVPGASVAVVLNGQIVYERAVGVKDRIAGGAVDVSSQFMMGSTSKPVTTMLMAAIADTGAAGWNTRAQAILPSFRVADASKSAQITLRDLVCNCVGAPRKDFELIYRANSLTPSAVVSSVAGYAVDAVFGSQFAYNNQLVAIGGWLSAAAAGAGGSNADLEASYDSQLQTRVFDKVGMGATTGSFNGVAARGNYAKPHGIDLHWLAQPQAIAYENFAKAISPAGGLWTTSGDLARFVITQLQRGIAPTSLRVASEANLTETWKPQVNVASGVSYGLGLYISTSDDRRVLTHDGNTLGFTSAMSFLPDHNVGAVVLANRQGTPFSQAVRSRALQLLFDKADTITLQFNAAVTQQRNSTVALNLGLADVNQSQAQPYLGAWNSPELAQMELQPQGASLDYKAQSFTARLRQQLRTDGQLAWTMFSPPLAGAVVQSNANGGLTVTHGDNVPYAFIR